MTTRAILNALAVAGLAAAGSLLGAPGAVADTCPTYNLPNELVLVSGTPQSAKLDTAFQTSLQVQFENSNGCAVTTQLAGLPVTFTAPGSGPSGTFAASGSNAVLVGSGTDGTASASMFTANSLPGGYQVVASSEYGSVSFSLVNTASGMPATISPLSPARQSARVGGQYGSPLKVKVVDANGVPVPGANVTFALGSSASSAGGAPSAGASFVTGSAQATEVTNASGVATSPLFTANSATGTFTATATTAGIAGASTFMLDNLAAKSATISANGHGGRSATVGKRYGEPIRVDVLGGNGKPDEGVTVTFSLGAAGGASGTSAAGATFAGGSTQATEVTDAAGVATSPRLTANTTAGTFDATASTTVTTKTVVLRLRNLPAKPASVTAGVAATESAPVGSRFPVRLAAKVEDVHGNVVPGVIVTFTAPARGPSGQFAGRHARVVTARTDAAGVAVAPPFVANGKQGGYVVRARAGGHSAAFALVNQPAP